MTHPHKRHLLRDAYPDADSGGAFAHTVGAPAATVMTDTPASVTTRLQALLSRKWLFAMVALLGLFRAVEMKSITEGVFQVLLLALIAAYLAANVLQKTSTTAGAKT